MQLVYIDNRGSGRSGRPDISTCAEQNIDDLGTQTISWIRKIVPMGRSYGRFVAQGYALVSRACLPNLLMTAPSGELLKMRGRIRKAGYA